MNRATTAAAAREAKPASRPAAHQPASEGSALPDLVNGLGNCAAAQLLQRAAPAAEQPFPPQGAAIQVAPFDDPLEAQAEQVKFP
jgi:hypothetical protein